MKLVNINPSSSALDFVQYVYMYVLNHFLYFFSFGCLFHSYFYYFLHVVFSVSMAKFNSINFVGIYFNLIFLNLVNRYMSVVYIIF